MAHEDLRDRLAPGSAGAFAALQDLGGVWALSTSVSAHARVRGPTGRPSIEQLAADQVAPDAHMC